MGKKTMTLSDRAAALVKAGYPPAKAMELAVKVAADMAEAARRNANLVGFADGTVGHRGE